MEPKQNIPQDVPAWTFTAYNHIHFDEVTEDCGVVTVDLVPESKNKNGTVHGGLFSAMADCAASATARSDGADYVTQSMTLNFLRNTREGTITAKASIIKRGRQTAVARVEITDQDGKLLADGSLILHRVQR